jgi:hypothetical protein
MLTKILKMRGYPGALQWLSVLFFVPVVGWLLFGPPDKDNLANLLIWLVWWPLLCIMFIVAGRIWCGVCPFSKISDGLQRWAGLRLPVPDFLKEQGLWLILIAFLLLSWLEETAGIVDSPRQTAIMLLTILTGAVAFGLFFQGRVWCRYVCPIGGISHVYARGSLFKVRPQEAICADCTTKDCVVPDAQYAGCPMHLSPFAMDSVANCNLCGACLKRCQHGSLRVSLEIPSQDLEAASPMQTVVVWLIALLAGLISFLNGLDSGRLPLETWVDQAAYPVLAKTLLMAVTLAASWWLLNGVARLAAGRSTGLMPPAAWLALGARPLIPLLLFSHLGHVGAEFWADGGLLLAPLAETLQAPGLALPAGWGAPWTAYFNALCIGLGLVLALAVLGWTAARAVGLNRTRLILSFGLFYLVFAGWNLYATWPPGTVETEYQPSSVPDRVRETQPEQTAAPGAGDGGSILWLFAGINAALLALALIARRSGATAGTDNLDFSATKTWTIRDASTRVQAELLDWLVTQAAQARWRVPPTVALANAGQEVINFLQRALPAGTPLTLLAIMRKNKGVLTISHGGRPLTLPDYRGEPSLDSADEAALAGIELRLAAAQLEHLSYHARMSDKKCSFTLRQTL